MAIKIIETDTTSYPNMTLETVSQDGENPWRYDLKATEGYVIHCHENCILPDEENGIEGKCSYYKAFYFPATIDLTTINEHYVAVLESSVTFN